MERTTACPSCQRGVFPEDAFCSWCGASIQERNRQTGESRRVYAHRTIPTRDRQGCASCNSPILPGDDFCSTCGAATGMHATGGGFGQSWRAIGRRITETSGGKYRIVRELGRGGMGVVLMARDTELERRVAIKVLAPSLLGDDSMVMRFQREARTIASLRHESVVSVYDVGRAGDLHYFVMDFIDGVSLSRILRAHGPLPIPVIETFLLQVGSALAYAHRPGRTVVHRDVKPSNIMIDPEGIAVVTDFGISKVTETSSGLTKTGLVIGTPEYMSPEQCRGTTVTAESDQYSLGAVVYAMLTGAPPFTGAFYKVLMAHQMEPVPPLLEARPDCPPELAEATERMLEKRPSDRWTSIREALRALRLRPPFSGDPVLDTVGDLVRATLDPERGPATREAGEAYRTPTAVEIEPVPPELEIGDRLDLSASVVFEDGGKEASPDIEWETTDPSILRVDPDTGELAAVSVGEARVTARVAGVSRSVDMAVRQAAVVELVLAPGNLELEVGEARRIRAEPRNRHGTALERAVIWSSSNPRTASVSETGEVTAHREGTANVLAHCQGLGASLEVAVVPAAVADIEVSGTDESIRVGDSLSLQATPLSRSGTRLERAVTWTSSAPDVAEVGPDGVVRARREGSVEIRIEAEDRRVAVPLLVLPALVGSVAIEGGPASLSVGDRATLHAVAWDPEGRVLDRAIAWSCDAPDVLRVGPDGTVEGLAEGRAEVLATCEDRTARVSVEVRPPPVTRIEVSTPADALLVGDTFHLEARMYDRRGRPREGSPEWTVDDSGVLQPLAPGLFRAVAEGEAVVTATAEEGETRVTLRVVGAPVAARSSVDEAPADPAETPTLAMPGSPRPVEAGADPSRREATVPAALRAPATWIVVALVGGAAATAWLRPWELGRDTPPAPTIADLTIVTAAGREPVGDGPLALLEGDSVALAGLSAGPDGTPLDVGVEWSTSEPSVASVDGNGMLTAAGPGEVSVVARVDTLSRSVTIRVEPRPVTIAIVGPDGRSPPGGRLELEEGESLRLEGRVSDRRGDRVETPVSWGSSRPDAARIDASGLVRGVAEGSATITATMAGAGAGATLEEQVTVAVVRPAEGPPTDPPPESQPPGPAVVTLFVEGHWAYVVIDGDTLDTDGTPANRPRRVTLETGPDATHTLRIMNPQYTPLDTTFTLSPGDSIAIRKTLIGRSP